MISAICEIIPFGNFKDELLVKFMIAYNFLTTDIDSEASALETQASRPDSVTNTVAGIVRVLLDDIIAGKLAPGHRLREVEVCERLDVSRTPVREAFRVLQSEGFLVHVPRCGVVVAELRESEVKDLWELRSIVEQAACSLAARSGSAKGLRNIAEVQQRLEELSPYEPTLFADLDTMVHFAIARAAGNKHLEATIAHLWRLASLARIRSLWSLERSRASCAEHRNIVDAIIARDEVLANRFMKIHMRNSFLSIRDMLREQKRESATSAVQAGRQKKKG